MKVPVILVPRVTGVLRIQGLSWTVIPRHIGAVVGAWVLKAIRVKGDGFLYARSRRNRGTASIHPLPLAHPLADLDTTHPPSSQY